MLNECSERAGEVTRVLKHLRGGDETAFDRLVPLVVEELRGIAGYLMKRESPGHTLQPTALVNEALIRLLGADKPDWNDRKQFLAVAAGCMRRVLVDHARRRDSEKRGGGLSRVTLQTDVEGGAGSTVDVLALNDAMDRLAKRHAQQARIVELRYFGGMTIEETADYLDVGVTTVKSGWLVARAWLFRELTRAAAL